MKKIPLSREVQCDLSNSASQESTNHRTVFKDLVTKNEPTDAVNNKLANEKKTKTGADLANRAAAFVAAPTPNQSRTTD